MCTVILIKDNYLFQDPEVNNDIFLVNTQDDAGLAKQVRAMLQKQKKDVKVQHVGQIKAKADTWQHDVYSAMLSSAR